MDESNLILALLLVTTAFFAVLCAYLLFLLRNRELRRQKDAEYELLLQQATDAIFLFDRKGGILLANDEAARLLNVRREDVVNRTACDFLSADTEKMLREAQASAERSTDGMFHLEATFPLLDGRDLWLEASGRVLPEGRILAMVRDQTTRHELERENQRMATQLVERQRMESLGNLAGGVAHDFNNLMTVVLANADEAASRTPADARSMQANLNKIVTAAQRAGELTQQLLAYSGQSSFHRQPVNVNEMIDELGGLLRSAISVDVNLTFELARGLPLVHGDAARLRQVAMNLVLNASDAIHESGTILIRSKRVSADEFANKTGEKGTDVDGVLIEVIDDGTGMTSEIKDQIFDPFFTTKSTGRGLGLAACHGIIRGHGGQLTVESEFGEGSTFRVLLPGMSEESALNGVEVVPRNARPSGCILVIDDNKDVRDSTAAMLRRFGYETIVAAGGEAGLKEFIAATDDIDCALIDLSMPGMDGHDTARALWGVRASLPVILMSGFAAEHEGTRLPGNTYALQKPFTPDALRERVHSALDG